VAKNRAVFTERPGVGALAGIDIPMSASSCSAHGGCPGTDGRPAGPEERQPIDAVAVARGGNIVFGSFKFFQQIVKSPTVQKITGDAVEQAFVDEANDRLGTKVYTRPTLGGGMATLWRGILKPVPFTPARTFPTHQQSQSRSNVNIETTAGGFGEFHKKKSEIYKFYRIEAKKISAKDELFVMMVTIIIKDCESSGEIHKIQQRIDMAREYVDHLTEEEAAQELGVLIELRNRENIPAP